MWIGKKVLTFRCTRSISHFSSCRIRSRCRIWALSCAFCWTRVLDCSLRFSMYRFRRSFERAALCRDTLPKIWKGICLTALFERTRFNWTGSSCRSSSSDRPFGPLFRFRRRFETSAKPRDTMPLVHGRRPTRVEGKREGNVGADVGAIDRTRDIHGASSIKNGRQL